MSDKHSKNKQHFFRLKKKRKYFKLECLVFASVLTMCNMLCIGFRVRPLPKSSSTCTFRRIMKIRSNYRVWPYQVWIYSARSKKYRFSSNSTRKLSKCASFRNFLLLFPKKTYQNWQTLNFRVSVTWIEKQPVSLRIIHSLVFWKLWKSTDQLDTKLDPATWDWFTDTYVIIFPKTQQNRLFLVGWGKSCLLDGVQHSKCRAD